MFTPFSFGSLAAQNLELPTSAVTGTYVERDGDLSPAVRGDAPLPRRDFLVQPTYKYGRAIAVTVSTAGSSSFSRF